MKLSELDYEFPDRLIATEPKYPPRVLWSEPNVYEEISFDELKSKFSQNDVLVVNRTKVSARKVFARTDKGREISILFLTQINDFEWEVLYPSSRLKKEEALFLPTDIRVSLKTKGIPQRVTLSSPIDESFFNQYGELPLPPYIHKARNQEHMKPLDKQWYQTDFAQDVGSVAAPTAGLHFKAKDLEELKSKGIHILEVVLHVGIGTFLPVQVENLNEHPMHKEWVEISKGQWDLLQKYKSEGAHIWSLGTTSTRALEAMARQHFVFDEKTEAYSGDTNLLIKPGYEFKVVDRLLTNFHQPKTTLLALVYAFAGKNRVHEAYQYAIKNNFRFFSYGDLSAWTPSQ